MIWIIQHRSIILASRDVSPDLVERAPDGTPKAFRMWRAGENPTDKGVHSFTENSARMLTEEQSVRGNLFSIDVDHMSLNSSSPPEARKAVGWFRIETRASSDGPELWATDVEWTEAVRAGLTSDPPEWKYFSPAYDVDKKTGRDRFTFEYGRDE